MLGYLYHHAILLPLQNFSEIEQLAAKLWPKYKF